MGDQPDETQWPRVGASYNVAHQNPGCDLPALAERLRDVGCTFTRLNAEDPWAIGERDGDGRFKPGQYDGTQIVERARDGDGRFNLSDVNERHYDRLRWAVQHMNARGIVVQVSIFGLYGWSTRKEGMLWVPDMNLQPYRRNVQGVRWEGDGTFDRLPDALLEQHIFWTVNATKDLACIYEPGNEMPEKPMHFRIAQAIRALRPGAIISTNRQDDTPGQYRNMQVGQGLIDMLALHGKDSLAYLDEDWPYEPVHKTFRSRWADRDGIEGDGSYEPDRIIMSTDGCRASVDPTRTYDYDTLLKVCRDHKARGFSIEHQLSIKMRPFTDGRFDLNDFRFDADFLKALTR